MLTVKISGQIGTCAIDADIDAGIGITALYGPSGAGKSTILRAIAGLWTPADGMIEVGGRVLFDSHSGVNVPTHKRRLGVVFQEPLLFPHLNAGDNLRFGLRSGRTKNDGGWDGVVEMLELGALLERMPRNLSGGEAQRVALGRAILASPELILLDEPLTGLDDMRRRQVLPYLERLRDETKIPIVYVSHHRGEILHLADLIFMVEEGTAKQELTPGEFEEQTRPQPMKRRDEV